MSVKSNVNSAITGSWLSKQWFVKRLPSIFYITVLIVIYIYNIFDNQKIHRDIIKLEREISKLTVTSNTTKTERISITKESNIITEIEKRGLNLYEITNPPKPLR